jgi:hypothetical protein
VFLILPSNAIPQATLAFQMDLTREAAKDFSRILFPFEVTAQ